MVKTLLQVSPHMRPDSEKILLLPSVVSRLHEKIAPMEYENNSTELLKTIKIPKNLCLLTDQLPKPT